MKNKLDIGGIFVAFICIIHCIALPIFTNFVPLFFYSVIDNKIVDSILLTISLIIGIKILIVKYKYYHFNILPIITFCVGIIMLFIKIFCFEKEKIWWSTIALSLIVIAHISNIYFSNNRIKK